MLKQDYQKYDTFIFDLDGTIYIDNKLIPNAVKTVNTTKELGKQVIFISNKTTGSIKDYYNLLKKNGMNIHINEILSSTLILQKYIKENHPDTFFYALGENKFIQQLEDYSGHYCSDPNKIEIVIVTLDRTLNYEKLEIAAKAIENGAKFYAANIDDTCPVEGGEILDAGSTISALEKRTHVKLQKHFGKPSEFMIKELKSRLKFPLSKCLLIGDRLQTDIKMGKKIGIDTALVSTGIKNRVPDLSGLTPTYYFDSVYDLISEE